MLGFVRVSLKGFVREWSFKKLLGRVVLMRKAVYDI